MVDGTTSWKPTLFDLAPGGQIAGLLKIGFGQVLFTAGGVQRGPGQIGLAIGRVESDGLVVVGQGLVVPVELFERVGTLEIRVFKFRITPDGLVEVGQRLFVLPQPGVALPRFS